MMRVSAYALACSFALALSACDRVQVTYPSSTPPAALSPPTASPSPAPLPAAQAIRAIRLEQARLNRGVYVVCIANDGSLPRGMSSALAAAHGWPVLRTGARVRAICPVIGRAQIRHALRAHDGSTLFDARVVPAANAPHLAAPNLTGLQLQYCACVLRPSAAGALRDIGRDFFIIHNAD